MPTRLFFWPSESICCNAPREATKTKIGKTRLTYNCADLRSTKESLTLEGGTGWYLVVLGQYGAVLVDK